MQRRAVWLRPRGSLTLHPKPMGLVLLLSAPEAGRPSSKEACGGAAERSIIVVSVIVVSIIVVSIIVVSIIVGSIIVVSIIVVNIKPM